MRRARLALARRARFALWTARLRREVARCGGRLELEAPAGGVSLADLPRVVVTPDGGAGGVTRVRFGDRVAVGRGCNLEVWAGGDNELAIGDDAFLLDGVRLQLRGGVIRIGPRTQVRDWCVLKSEGELTAGEHVVLSHGVMIHCTERVQVGDLVGIAERVSLIDSDHTADGSGRHYLYEPVKSAPIVVGRNALLSANVVVLRGTTIGPDAVVGAGAVLTGGAFDGGHLIAGVPARVIRPLPNTAARATMAGTAPGERRGPEEIR